MLKFAFKDSLTNMLKNIPESFETECVQHLIKFGPRIIQRFVYWSTNPYHKRSEEPVARFSLEQPDLKTTLKAAKIKETNVTTSLNNQKTAEVGENNRNTSLNSQKTAEVGENNGNTSLNSQKTAEVGENNGNTSLNSQKTAEVGDNNGNTSLISQKTAEVGETNGNTSLKKTDTLANKKIAILSSNTQADVPVSLLSGTDLYMDISSQSHKPISILQLANEKLGDRISTNQTSDKTSVLSVEDISTDSDYIFQVEFPLFPLSRGFCITMTKKLSTLKTALYAMMESQKLKL